LDQNLFLEAVMDRVFVRAVRGRYPHRPGKLESRRIEANVEESENFVHIRLGDEDHPDFWMELVLEVDLQRQEQQTDW
jgi:hypothetical protein